MKHSCPSRASLLFLAPLAWLAFGCAANRPDLTCPKSGGPLWTEITSPHFLIETDLPEAMAREVAVEMERARVALLTVLHAPADEGATPVETILFERRRDFDALTNDTSLVGVFYGSLYGDAEQTRVLASHGRFEEATRITLQHELVHEILSRRTARIPWWLNEGLAEAYSTVRLDGEELVVGEPIPWSDFWEQAYDVRDVGGRIPKRWLAESSAPAFTDLLAASSMSVDESGRVRAYYTAAWKLVRVLRGDLDSKLRPRFAAMIEAMMSGKSGKDAFESAYAGLPRATLSGAYQSLLLDHREFVSTVPFKLPDPPKIAARAMSDAEVHALWARLATRRDYASSMKEIGRGLAETPGAAALLYVKASVQLWVRNQPVPTKEIAELRRLDPYNPRYVLLDVLGKVKPVGDEGASADRLDGDARLELLALLNLLTRTATSPHQQAVSAVALLAVGRGAEARALAQKVVEANPSCQSCLSAYAEVLLGVGDPRAAKDAAERALALLRETDPGEFEKKIIARAVEAMNKPPAPPGVP